MEKNKEKILEKIHDFKLKHWLWYSIILSIPSIWYTFIIPLCEKLFKFKDPKGNYKLWVVVLSGIIILLTCVITFFNNFYTARREAFKQAQFDSKSSYNKKLYNSMNKICKEKENQILNAIKYLQQGCVNNTAFNITDPCIQLKKIFEQITICLKTFMENENEQLNDEDFIIALAYRFPKINRQWRWADGVLEDGMPLKKLLNRNSKSTFNYLLKENRTYYFNNEKEEAVKENKYIYDSKDYTNISNEKSAGSIFCYRYEIQDEGQNIIDAMLSISTREKKFSNSNNPEVLEIVKQNMKSLVKDDFGIRIKIELEYLYYDALKKHKKQ